MSNRQTTFLLKKSGVAGKIPTQLLLGEIAINFADAKLYTSGTTAGSILPIGWDRVSKTGDTMTGTLYLPTISATTYLNIPYSGTVIGTGTTGYLPLWTGTTSLGTSTIQDTGTKILISGTTNVNRFQVANTLYVDTINNRLGVNTSTPYNRLSVVGTGATDALLDISTTHNALNDYAGFTMGSTAAGNNYRKAGIFSKVTRTVGNQSRLQFAVEPNDTGTNIEANIDQSTVMVIDYTPNTYAGKVGINTLTPSNALDVSGNTLITGNLTATTISATTYLNIPSPTFSGGTVTGPTKFTNGVTANTISATTYLNMPAATFSGGTVTGPTNFTNGVTANTISATTYQGLPISVVNTTNLFSTGLSNTGSGATATTNSIFFGNSAGSNATNANNSNFLGSYAGYGATNADDSNFFGQFAGYNAPLASGSLFVGINAGLNVTGGPDNTYFASVFIGPDAGNGATNANDSIFIGAGAGQDGITAYYSNFIGSYAGQGATNASNSNFMGSSTGLNAINAYNSNFFGTGAGVSATDASYSNFIGYYAGQGATNANNSNFFGQFAGASATNANSSNFFGGYAGQSATNANNSNLFGYNVGNATVLGSLGSNNIIIGTNISLSAGTTDSINIGGVLFGTGTYSNTTGNPSVLAQTAGRIGINVVNPTQALHVSGNSIINAGVTTNTDVIFTTGSINSYLEYNIQNKSNSISAQTGYAATADNGTLTTGFVWMGINNSTFNNPATYNIGVSGDTSFLGSGNDMYIANANQTKSIIFSTGKATTPYFNESMRIVNNGNLLIGTNLDAGQKLQVSGDTLIYGNLTATTISATTYLNLPGGGSKLKGSSIFNFTTGETDTVINTISSTLITNNGINGILFRPSGTTETSLDDFTLNGLSFNIENIIDNTSFDIRANAANNATGNYTINYSISY